jgi:hypothetical protein
MGHNLNEIREIVALDQERQDLREEVAAAGSPGEKVAKLKRVREIFVTEVGMVDDRLGRLEEIRSLLNSRIEEIDAQLAELD